VNGYGAPAQHLASVDPASIAEIGPDRVKIDDVLDIIGGQVERGGQNPDLLVHPRIRASRSSLAVMAQRIEQEGAAGAVVSHVARPLVLLVVWHQRNQGRARSCLSHP
jgi:hypothetical protein